MIIYFVGGGKNNNTINTINTKFDVFSRQGRLKTKTKTMQTILTTSKKHQEQQDTATQVIAQEKKKKKLKKLKKFGTFLKSSLVPSFSKNLFEDPHRSLISNSKASKF